jgi:hypothetical protein
LSQQCNPSQQAPELLCAIAMGMECVQSRVIKKNSTLVPFIPNLSADLVHSYYELWAWILEKKVGCIVFLGFNKIFFQKGNRKVNYFLLTR